MTSDGNSSPLYKRVLLKLSGEALRDEDGAISPKIIKRLVDEVGEVVSLGVQVAIVPGAGNFCRGAELSKIGLNRITGDHMGMVATILNALALRDVFENHGIACRVLSPIPLNGMVGTFDRRKAIYHLEQGRVVIIPGGTGNPLVTTDSAASLRSIEIEADALLKATQVDGVYSADPEKDPNATKYSKLTYKEALDKELAVMDLTAFCQCRDHSMEMRIFNIEKPGVIANVVSSYDEGTVVKA